MTKIVEELRQTLRGVPDFDVVSYLTNADRGMRLAAYAYLMEKSVMDGVPEYLAVLVNAAIDEDKPFGQYWALRAIDRQITLGVELDYQSRQKLAGLQTQLSFGADRAVLLRKILAGPRG